VFSCVFVTLWCNGHVDAVQGASGGSGPRATASSTAAAVHAVFTGATQTVELTASRVLARFLRPTSELDAKVVLGELLEDLHTVVHLPEWPSAAEYGVHRLESLFFFFLFFFFAIWCSFVIAFTRLFFYLLVFFCFSIFVDGVLSSCSFLGALTTRLRAMAVPREESKVDKAAETNRTLALELLAGVCADLQGHVRDTTQYAS
jgi:hypothetical protein